MRTGILLGSDLILLYDYVNGRGPSSNLVPGGAQKAHDRLPLPGAFSESGSTDMTTLLHLYRFFSRLNASSRLLMDFAFEEENVNKYCFFGALTQCNLLLFILLIVEFFIF